MATTVDFKRAFVPFDVDIKAVSTRGEFEGYGSVFGNVDFGGDVVMPGAFKRCLEEYKEKGQLPALYWMHDRYEPIGEWKEMYEDGKGLYVKGALWIPDNALGRAPIQKAMQAHNLLLSTGPKGLSIGWAPVKTSYGEQSGKRVVFLEEIELYEVSVVGFGMNPEAEVTDVKFDGEIPTKRDLERFLIAHGFSREKAKAFLAKGYAGIHREDGPDEVEHREDVSKLVDNLNELNSILKGE